MKTNWTFLFWDGSCFDALWHDSAVNDQNLPESGFSVLLNLKNSLFLVLYFHAQCDHKAFVPLGQILPEERIVPGDSCWMTMIDHTALCFLTTLLSGASWSPTTPASSHFFPQCSQEQPAGPDLLWWLCRRAKPSLLFGRAASYDWVLVRACRLVTGYLQRGHEAWALWSSGKKGLRGDFVVPCGPECEPQSLLTPSFPRGRGFTPNHDFPSPRLSVCDCRSLSRTF